MRDAGVFMLLFIILVFLAGLLLGHSVGRRAGWDDAVRAAKLKPRAKARRRSAA